MACIEEWTRKLENLGLCPLPSYWEGFIHAICAGTTTPEAVDFLIRLHSWPKKLLDLTRIYDISHEQSETLRGLYHTGGESVDFTQAVAKLAIKGRTYSTASNSRKEILDNVGKLNIKLRKRRDAEFDSAVTEEKDRLRLGEPPLPQEELNSLRQQFVSSTMSKKELKNLLAKAMLKTSTSGAVLVSPKL